MNEVKTITNVETQGNTPVNYDNINQGTVAVESSRAIAEAQGKLVIAKRFPRNEIAAFANVMAACQRPSLAEKAFYSYPRGGETVHGPTIRFAEELARCWGNLDYGIKELSQDTGKSEMQAYCWDLETNTMSIQNFTNPHKKEVTGRIKELTGLRDIYENNANMAARRLRARILAVLPSDLVDDATVDIAETKPHTTVFVSSSTPILTYFAPKIYIHEPNSNALVFLFSIPSNISVRFEKLPFSAMLNLYSFVPICIM